MLFPRHSSSVPSSGLSSPHLSLRTSLPTLQVCVALPLDFASSSSSSSSAAGSSSPQPLPQQQVFAFLPLRSYGLKMVVQVSV